MDFNGKVVVITGASGGIGGAAARMFAAAGAELALIGRSKERLAAVVEETHAGFSSSADITKSENCRAVLDETVKKYGRIDVLVNCAGAICRTDVADTTDEDWYRLFDINVHAVFFLSREAIKIMRKQKTRGSIVNIASNLGLTGRINSTAYASTKGAVVQMTRCMALDCGKDGIRVNAVCPGMTDTAMPMSMHLTPMTHEKLVANAVTGIPLQRMATPDEVANVILFVASDDASYMTGVPISVDGGVTAE